MEQVAGRKKSKFWFYAVEPIQGPPGSGSSVLPNGTALSGVNGHHNGNADTSGNGSYLSDAVQDSDVAMDFRRSLEGSLSPALSVES
ncbi:hypothetical protein SERLA73DRAFT_190036 [Serpula lacrymans var. lacrymans S7.3]|uniref:Uncharacterized protein n=2 Tax=Serpula lacrymans var. lacrymans TaxID=341189 RepID=F8QEZ3_SERL3|nr:uncharacterized protein SERLADRAFT_455619 [Serpula lacrymans var. lacrymans S7.9]EGN93156.1 hypothetical protein SERLA73DRAFT_190036 [Serpula lacrymans var. lacrymans S7.3]EGO31052.1 hypothetical protein SERLADRAFT_455619 [Serpula lacrymans var. lacrymans S7.9]